MLKLENMIDVSTLLSKDGQPFDIFKKLCPNFYGDVLKVHKESFGDYTNTTSDGAVWDRGNYAIVISNDSARVLIDSNLNKEARAKIVGEYILMLSRFRVTGE